MSRSTNPLPPGDLLELKRWNTPTIYNGWEQITRHNAAADAFNLEETRDYMPQMGPMVGYAVTVICQPATRSTRARIRAPGRSTVATSPAAPARRSWLCRTSIARPPSGRFGAR